MTYAEKLKDPRWQKRRLHILERDNWTCKNCYDKTKTLHIHHLDYEKGVEPWDYPDDYLLTLCEDCHKEIQDYSKIVEKNVAKSLRLAMKDQFMWFATDQLFCQDSEQIKDLIFYCFDLGINRVLEALQKEFEKRDRAFHKEYARTLNGKCPACGGDMLFNQKYDLFICDVCKYRPDEIADELKEEQNGKQIS